MASRAPLVISLLALAACRPSPASTAAPADKPYVSPLAGFDGPPPDDDPVAKEGSALTEGPLREASDREAPGMQPEGDLIASKLAPGQLFEQEFRLQPGRCYTLVAVGGEGVRELDATFETLGPVRGKSDVLASDSARGTTAVVGGGGTCFPWKTDATAMAAKFVLRVSAGSGVVVTQLYARSPDAE